MTSDGTDGVAFVFSGNPRRGDFKQFDMFSSSGENNKVK